MINKLELPELHMYDMSVLQLSLNLQNDKFALAIDRKFLHLFSLDSTYHIATFSEDYIVKLHFRRGDNFIDEINLVIQKVKDNYIFILFLFSSPFLWKKIEYRLK